MKEIDWQDWSQTTFNKAGKEDKPVLLDITAVWCHWCHVMDNKTYSDPEVVDAINKNYVPVRVENDKRPDINERYNQGGWPSTVFLTPKGQVIAGATYLPPEEMKKALKAVADFYKKNKEILAKPHKHKAKKPSVIKRTLKPELVDEIFKYLKNRFDEEFGGWGGQPKFPQPQSILFLLERYQSIKDKASLDMALKTLNGIASGLYDKEEGGFYRYSVTRDWREPHYEKLLDLNAQLLNCFLLAKNFYNSDDYENIILGTLKYLENTLWQQLGAFSGSQDAGLDESYYKVAREKREKMLKPKIDLHIYTSSNAQISSTLFKISQLNLNNRSLKLAKQVLDFLSKNCFNKDIGAYHYWIDGKAYQPGLFVDLPYFLKALIDGYQATKQAQYLSLAKELFSWLEKFYHPELAGFWDRLESRERLKPIKNIEENIAASLALIDYYKIFPEPEAKKIIEKTLIYLMSQELFADSYAGWGRGVARYLRL